MGGKLVAGRKVKLTHLLGLDVSFGGRANPAALFPKRFFFGRALYWQSKEDELKMVDFHDPRAEVGVKREPYGLAVDLKRMNDPCVAFLANGFPDSERFLEKIAHAMTRLMPQLNVRMFNKGDASSPAPANMLNEISDGCHAAVAAYGH